MVVNKHQISVCKMCGSKFQMETQQLPTLFHICSCLKNVKLRLPGYLSQHIKLVARDLGVMFHSNLCFKQYINKLVQSCFYHLRNIAKIRSILTLRGTETLVHACLSSHLDYCIIPVSIKKPCNDYRLL